MNDIINLNSQNEDEAAAAVHLYFHKCMQPSINDDRLYNEFTRVCEVVITGGDTGQSSLLIRFPTF